MGRNTTENIDRTRKAERDPETVEEALRQRVDNLEYQLRLIRQQMQVPTIHTFDRAKYIDPTQGELFWDHQNQRSYVRHHDHYRPTQPPTFHIKVFKDDKVVTTGDKKFAFMVSRDMGGWTPAVGESYPSFYLYDAEAYVTTAGANTIQIRNITQAADMLSVPLTIDSGEFTTRTAATPRVIHATNSVVAWGDLVAIDVDVAGGMGLGVILVFNPIIP